MDEFGIRNLDTKKIPDIAGDFFIFLNPIYFHLAGAFSFLFSHKFLNRSQINYEPKKTDPFLSKQTKFHPIGTHSDCG
jgi:hypothetical protein